MPHLNLSDDTMEGLTYTGGGIQTESYSLQWSKLAEYLLDILLSDLVGKGANIDAR